MVAPFLDCSGRYFNLSTNFKFPLSQDIHQSNWLAYMHPLWCLVGGQSFFMIKNAHLLSFINPSKAIFSFFVGMETRTAQIFEGMRGDLSCPNETILVISAFYGRLNRQISCQADRRSFVSGRSVVVSGSLV